MDKDFKILIAGRHGMVGSALQRSLERAGYHNIVGPPSSELDLCIQNDVDHYFSKKRPDYVLLAAARVGGIMEHSKAPADFLLDNLQMQNNVISASYKYGVKKLILIASSAIYPKLAGQPIQESSLLTGSLEPEIEAYALSKIVGLKLCEYMNNQYGTQFICVVPCNLYGVGDNYTPIRAHLVPALIQKCHQAKVQHLPHFTVWGTGEARRELMCSDDLADACVCLLCQKSGLDTFYNVGTGVDFSIKEVVQKVIHTVGYTGEILFDSSKPEGVLKRVMDSRKIQSLGWKPRIILDEGLSTVYKDFLQRFPSI